MVLGDTTTALRLFEALPDTTYCERVPCVEQKLVEATLLAARGEDLKAAALLDEWIPSIVGIVGVLGLAERARIAERLGDRTTALRDYQHVADAWRNADPELAGYVAEAREGLARLTQEPR
jgi:serine/threonine-protein kinase